MESIHHAGIASLTAFKFFLKLGVGAVELAY